MVPAFSIPCTYRIFPDDTGHKCLVAWPTSYVFINGLTVPPADSSPGHKQMSGRTDGPFAAPDRMKSCTLLRKQEKKKASKNSSHKQHPSPPPTQILPLM